MDKKSIEQDGQIYRLWYLPREWCDIIKKIEGGRERGTERVTEWDQYVSNGDNVKGSDWQEVFQSGWDQVKQLPHIFLSRAPLTLGHSELVIPSPPYGKISEAKFFECASHIIKRAIATFVKAFDCDKIHTKDKTFENLSKFTKTEGQYIKTLILKASANENLEEQYKVHLVPYFESHDIECKKRYDTRHRGLKSSKGGLLAWLGEREDEADKLEADSSLWKYILDDSVNNDLQMSELAIKKRDRWQQVLI